MFGLSRSSLGLLASGLVVAGLGLVLSMGDGTAWAARADQAKPVLADADLTKLIEDNVKTFQAGTKSATEFNRVFKNIEQQAYALAVYAQAGMGNEELGKKAPALRDAAVSLAEAAKKKDFNEAKKHVATIAGFKTMKPGEARSADVPLNKAVSLKNLMLNVKDVGLDLDKSRKLASTQWNIKGRPDELALQASKMAALSVGMLAHAPEKDPDVKKGQTRKIWVEASEEVQAATLELLAAAKAKKPDDFKAAYKKMDTACTKCHEPYRVEAD